MRGDAQVPSTPSIAEVGSPSISDDETVQSESSSEETDNDTSYVTDAKLIGVPVAKSSSSFPFTQKLRPRGRRGKESIAKCKAKYEATKEERNKTLIPMVSVPKRGKNNTCVSVFKNG